MKVVVFVKGTQSSERGELPTQELLTAMGAYNQRLVEAGIMEAGEGLKPSRAGARVTFSGPFRTVSCGPFEHPEELVSGFWIWNVKDMDEAIEWVKRCPNPMPEDSVIEIRPAYGTEDFGESASLDPDQEHLLREAIDCSA